MLAQSQFDGHVGHLRAHHAGHQFVAPHAVTGQQVEQLVAVVQAPGAVHHLQPVGIAIQGNADIGIIMRTARTQASDAWRPPVVDVQPIGGTANGHHVGAQFMEHLGRDLVGCAMRGIDHDAHAPERGRWQRCFCKTRCSARRHRPACGSCPARLNRPTPALSSAASQPPTHRAACCPGH